MSLKARILLSPQPVAEQKEKQRGKKLWEVEARSGEEAGV
jgi:hypothetical protein